VYGGPFSGHPGLAIPDLLSRRRYEPPGLASPALFVWLVLGFLVMAGAGGLCLLLSETGPDSFPRFVTSFLFPIALFLLASVFTLVVIHKGGVQRLWIAVLINGLMAAVFLAVFSQGDSSSGLFTPDNPIPADFRFVVLLIDWVFLTVIASQVSISDARRVFYRTPQGDRPGEEHRAFFNSGRAADVLGAVARGDAAALAALRKSPPSGGHSYQSFAALTLTLPTPDTAHPAYLHIKNVYFGGGPLFSTRLYGTFGLSVLKHVALGHEDVEKLKYLIPELIAPAAPQGKVGKASEGTPLGLPQGSPSSVESPSGSFIRLVDTDEKISSRLRGACGQFLLLAVFPLLLFTLVPALLLDESNPVHEVVLAILGITMFLGMLVGLAAGIFHGPLGRRLLGRAVARRRNKLFTPDKSTIFLWIEESRTFHKQKLVPEEYGLLQVVPGMLLLETGRTRARLMASDVRLEFHSTGSSTGLKIAAGSGPGEWAITVVAPGTFGSLQILFKDYRKRAEDLWRRIYQQSLPEERQ